MPIYVEDLVAGHAIRDQSATYFNLLNNFSFGLTLSAFYLVSFLIILSFSLLIHELICRVRLGQRKTLGISKRIILVVNSFRVKKCSTIGIFVLFVQIFIWVTKLLVSNSIKTNKVVSLNTIRFDLKIKPKECFWFVV